MSKSNELPVRTTGKDEDQLYFLRSGDDSADTPITEKQYNAILEFGGTGGTDGGLSDSTILRLHQEQDPASEFYKGKPVDNEAEEPVVVQGDYYGLTEDNVKSAQVVGEKPAGDSTHSTEDVSKTKSAEDFPVSTKQASIPDTKAEQTDGTGKTSADKPTASTADKKADTKGKSTE